MIRANDEYKASSRRGPNTLALDIGGTGLKASVLDSDGRMVVDRVRIPTPHPSGPAVLMRALARLVSHLPPFDRISVGFPGVIRAGRVMTAPHFGTEQWRGYPLESAVSRRLGRPARLLNDAEVQGLGIIRGKWLEVVLTLGTGVGSAVFSDGRLTPHLELAQHPIHDSKTYDDYLGNAARLAISAKKWNRRVLKAIGIVHTLLNYDQLYIGGGNATRITAVLPRNVHIASNDAGLTGGIRLWDEKVWQGAQGHRNLAVVVHPRSGRRAAIGEARR